MKNEQPDKSKLIKIASFMRKEFNLTVQREAILTFSREDDHLVNFSSWLTEEQYKKYIIHVPDLLFFVGNKMWIFEIDGYIHYSNSSVVFKDVERDRIYTAAHLNWRKINELEVLQKLGQKPDRSATASEIITEVRKLLKQII
ncbi:MAG: hypothetical protein IIC67_10625 [Thaumarchaeota archaeon]|nr:hypothetical protein [Nitrososphaerota archaeon]